MTGVLRTAASLSLSGSLVIAAILLLRPLVRGRVSARWQYYVWLVALARLVRSSEGSTIQGLTHPMSTGDAARGHISSSTGRRRWVRPCIVLPSEDLTEEAFRCTVLHELTHCRRWDGAYKWLVQAAVCLHWFNPLVCLMAREIARDCELACDEAVVLALGEDGRRAYGDTLLRVLETGGKLSGVGASVTLCEDGKLLKERLEAIMKVKRQTKRTAALSLMLAGALSPRPARRPGC